MIDLKSLWTFTAGLYAVAAGLLVLANSVRQAHCYEFAESPLTQTVWRGDTVTGHTVLCATDIFADDAEYSAKARGITNFVSRC